MPKIKYRGKKLVVSEDDYQGIVRARAAGVSRVDVQQPDGKDRFATVWLEVAEID